MGSKGFFHLINVGVGTRNSEVSCIGVVEKIVGLRKCEGKAVEKGRGYTSALRLRDPYSGRKGGGEDKVVSAAGCTPFQIVRRRGIVLEEGDGATKSAEGRTTGKWGEKGDWAREVWISAIAVEGSLENRRSPMLPARSHRDQRTT